MSIPGWVIRLGSTIAKGHVDDEGAKEALKMAKKIKKLKLLVIEDGNPVQQKDIDQMLDKARSKDGFEDMIFVKNEDARVNMLIRTKGETIKNLLITVCEENEFVMVSLKSKIKMSDLNDLIRSLQDEVDLDLGIEGKEKETSEEKVIAAPTEVAPEKEMKEVAPKKEVVKKKKKKKIPRA